MAKKTTTKKPTVTKNLKAEPIKWIITHPQGHVYVRETLASLLLTYGVEKEQLEARGWKFKPIYES